MDRDAKYAIEGIYTGELARSLKKNSQYAMTGTLIGIMIGVLIAGVTGQSKLLFALGGGGIGYGIGNAIGGPKEKNEKDNV